MTPTLYSIAGPLKGSSRALTEETLTIGRDRSNQIAIGDLHLSRQHCSIKREGSEFKVVDLGSRNGVFVNSIPIRERILNHGDRIEIGSSMFIFSKGEESTDENILANPLSESSSQTTKWDDRLDLRDRLILGESGAMKKVLELIRKISKSDTTVLICGETGTGKELAARAIHTNSGRAKNPFVAINCAALPEALLESELFGHEKGAFTGAIAQKKGKLEMADAGTLFLDEIAELPLVLQAKLLRFLQEREFERVGGTRTIKVDLRLLAATNKNLEKEVSKGAFRQDLLYRINVVQLEMPALRDLEDDVLLLANFFVSRFSQKLGRRLHGISKEAQQCLMQYDWPGNVRELENVLERAVLLGVSEVILPEDLPDSLLALKQPGKADPGDFHQAVNEYKKRLIKKALEAADYNYNEAAASLGIHSTHLYRLVRNLRLDDAMKK